MFGCNDGVRRECLCARPHCPPSSHRPEVEDAQDLIARQAPIDRKLKTVDSLALQKQIRVEQSLYPAFDIYPSWNNEMVTYKDVVFPESYTFDLTGFCMPTEHTKITDVFGYRPRRRRGHYGLDWTSRCTWAIPSARHSTEKCVW